MGIRLRHLGGASRGNNLYRGSMRIDKLTNPGFEARLLLASATTAPTVERTERARQSLRQIRDWDALVRLAMHHGVLPLVHRYLTAECGSEFPAEAAAKFRLQDQLNVLHNRHLTNELARYLRAFAQAGVRAIWFKGPILASLAYGDIGLRQFSDLDLLIAKSDLATVAEILIAAGYNSHLSRRDGITGGYFQEFEECFSGPNRLGAIDVHWKMTPKAFPFGPSDDEVFARAISYPLGDDAVPTLAPDDLFLYLCVHGAKHGWPKLEMICDIAQLLRAPGLIDLDVVLRRASHLGSRRMVLLAIYLADAIGGDAIGGMGAEGPLAEARRDRAAVTVGDRVMRALFSRLDSSDRVFDPWRVPLGAIEDTRARMVYIVRRLLAPTMGDFEMIPLPAAFFPLYWVIRPFRMTIQYGPRLIRGAFDATLMRTGNQSR